MYIYLCVSNGLSGHIFTNAVVVVCTVVECCDAVVGCDEYIINSANN